MIASTAALVDRLLEAEEAVGGDLHPMIVAGAGTTIATCGRLPSGSVSSWSGLIETALRDAAKNERAKQLIGEAVITDAADRCRTATSAEELLRLCNLTCRIYDEAKLNISTWIFDKLTALGKELEERLKKDEQTAPLLSAVRDWQATFGTVVATTNYDKLLSVARCGDPIELYEAPLSEKGSAALADVLNGSHNVIHLHGRYDKDDSAVFSGEHYRRLMELNIEPDSFARRLFDSTLPIFVGCGAGLADQDLSLLIGERMKGGSEHLKRAIILHKGGDTLIAEMMKHAPFDTRCVAIAFGDDHGDLVPFLEQARIELLAKGFRGRRQRRADVRTEAWLRARRTQQKDHLAFVPVPPLQLNLAVRELPLRAFHGTLLLPRVPTYELQAIDPAIDAPEAGAALHEDARFDPVPLGVLDKTQLAVLLGDGGSGKTALTKLLVARAAADPADLITAHIRVADYFRSHEHFLDKDSGAADLWQFLVEDLRCNPTATTPAPPHEDVERALLAAAEQGRVLVILDGLDEVSRLSDRAAIVSEAVRLHERLASATLGTDAKRSNQLILTSRFSGYRTAPVLHPAAQHLVLCPLMPAEVARLHDAFFEDLIAAGASPAATLHAKRDALRQEVASSQLAMTSWIDTPLMAVLVAVAFLANGKLPASREALFDTIVEQGCAFVIDRAPKGSLSVRDLRQGLEEAAFRIFSLGVQDALSRTSLHEGFRLLRPRATTEAIDRLVAIATSDESLLRERGADHFAFVHRGVLEYLCGCRLSADANAIAAKAGDASWRQPASFASGMALRTDCREPLILAVATASSIANGYRPLLSLLRGALYAARLPRAARLAVARAAIAAAADLARHIISIDQHRALTGLLRAISAEPHLLRDFETALLDQFALGSADGKFAGALLVCEGLNTSSAPLISAIDAAGPSSDAETNLLAERVQRLVLRRRIGTSPAHIRKPLIAFGASIDSAQLTLRRDQLAAWRRGIASLAGGIADIGHADLRPLRMTLAKLLAAPDARRNLLLFTLTENIRALAIDQQDAVALAQVEKAAKNQNARTRTLQDAVRDLRRRPDLVMGIATYLDQVAEPMLNDNSRPAAFDNRLVYNTPLFAEKLLATLERGLPLDTLLSAKSMPIGSLGECAVISAITGQPIDVDTGADLALAMSRVADGAARSLLEVEATLGSHGALDLEDLGNILADAVVDLKLALRMPARFDLRPISGKSSYDQRNFRESLARTITGEGLSTSDDVYNAMVILDTLDASKRVGGLVELGHSRLVGNGNSSWDLPPFPLPHLHESHATYLGEAMDNLEACPSEISAFRSDTLRGLAKIEHPEGEDVRLELNAALSQDWGAQAIFDEASRFEALDWGDRGCDALAAARAAQHSLWKARALTRLLRLASADRLEACEQEIAAEIETLGDPFEQVLAYELLAERAHPGRGQSYALRAFDRLAAGRPFPPSFFKRKIPPSLASAERCARAYARLSVWLPRRQREQALVAAVALASEVAEPWPRTTLLKELAPYARHSARAQKHWDRTVRKLPSFHRAHCAGESGGVLAYLVDWMLDEAPALAKGEADPIVAYALLRDARRRIGDELAPWEVLERAECTKAGADRVRDAFDSAAVPKISSASLLSLRRFCEAGMSEIAAFVVSRVSRHPPGTASVLAEADPALALTVRAVARGMDATSAPAIVDALFGDDGAKRALAIAVLEPAVAASITQGEEKPFAPFTKRRSTVEELDTIFAFATSALATDHGIGSRTHASRYIEQILFETAAEADRLIEFARDRAEEARWLLARIELGTPQFLHRLVSIVDPDEELAPFLLALVARTLHIAPMLGEYLVKNGTADELWRWIKTRSELKRFPHAAAPEDAAAFLKTAARLDPTDMDQAYVDRHACKLARKSDLIPALTAWGAMFFSQSRPDSQTAVQAAAAAVAADQRTLTALVGFCAWDANAGTPLKAFEGRRFRAHAWPIMAGCIEHCPVTLQARMHGAAMFDDLPTLARNASSWVTRRSAFQLMPLEWQGRPARASLDIIESALGAAEDVWEVQEAALATVASIRLLDYSALDFLYAKAESGGVRALMAFRMINAIINNDRASAGLRQHAQLLIERALNSDLGDCVIEHGIATANAPPRMRLREVLLQQVFADA